MKGKKGKVGIRNEKKMKKRRVEEILWRESGGFHEVMERASKSEKVGSGQFRRRDNSNSLNT